MNLSLAKFETSELPQEWVAHTSYDNQLVGNVEHVQYKFDFVSDFEPSQYNQNWLSRVIKELAKILKLSLHKTSCHSELVIDSNHTRMSSMSSSKGIVYVDVS